MPFVDGATIDQKWANFSIFQTDYKKVRDHGIRADFLILKSLRTGGKIPVITQFHGGALTFGDSLYSPWFPIWILQLAERHNAVIATANYRLLPEATGVEILSDIDEWWKWLHSSGAADQLSSLSTPIELDLDRVITTGESAGGLLSVYLALTYPDEIRSSTAAYPMFNQDGPTDGLETPVPLPEVTEVRHPEVLKMIDSGAIVSSDTRDSRLKLAHWLIGELHLFQCYPRNSSASPVHRERLYQLQRLEQPETKLPPGGLVILHGVQDPMVPAKLSERFVHVAREKLSGRQGADKIVLSIQEGSHGFDNPVGLEEPWLQEALQTAISSWLE